MTTNVPYPSGYTPSLYPEIAIAVRLGVGAIPARNDYTVVMLGNKTSAGSATAAVVSEVFGPEDANVQAGARSELAHMARAWFKVAPRGRVKICPVAEGDTPVAATAVVLFGTTAAANGVIRTRINGRVLPEVGITTGDTASVIAAAWNTMLGLYTDLPCTAAVSTATVTLTAAQAGPRGNDLRIVVEIVPAGATGVATVVTLNGVAPLAKVDGYFGAGSGTPGSVADSYAAALAAVNLDDVDFIVAACNDDTNRGLVSAHVTAASAIAEGRRRVAVVGSIESTLATVQADAVAHNNALVTLVHLKGAHNTTGEMAAAYAAARIYGDGRLKGIVQYTAANQNGLSLAPAIYACDVTQRLTKTQKAALLADGVTPLEASAMNPGYAQVSRPATTRTVAASGAKSYAVIDPSKVTVAFELARRIEVFAAEAYAGKNLAPNPTDPDNTPSSPDVTWPDAIREDILAILRIMEDEAKLVNVNAHAADVAVTVSGTDNTVAVASVPFAVIAHLHSVIYGLDQVG